VIIEEPKLKKLEPKNEEPKMLRYEDYPN